MTKKKYVMQHSLRGKISEETSPPAAPVISYTLPPEEIAARYGQPKTKLCSICGQERPAREFIIASAVGDQTTCYSSNFCRACHKKRNGRGQC